MSSTGQAPDCVLIGQDFIPIERLEIGLRQMLRAAVLLAEDDEYCRPSARGQALRRTRIALIEFQGLLMAAMPDECGEEDDD